MNGLCHHGNGNKNGNKIAIQGCCEKKKNQTKHLHQNKFFKRKSFFFGCCTNAFCHCFFTRKLNAYFFLIFLYCALHLDFFALIVWIYACGRNRDTFLSNSIEPHTMNWAHNRIANQENNKKKNKTTNKLNTSEIEM